MKWGCVFIFLTPNSGQWVLWSHGGSFMVTREPSPPFFALLSVVLALWLQTNYCDASYHIHILEGGRHRVCLVAK